MFVLAVALVAIALYAKSITLGVSWSKCFLRWPTLIIGFWAAVGGPRFVLDLRAWAARSGRLTGSGPSAMLRQPSTGVPPGGASEPVAASLM